MPLIRRATWRFFLSRMLLLALVASSLVLLDTYIFRAVLRVYVPAPPLWQWLLWGLHYGSSLFSMGVVLYTAFVGVDRLGYYAQYIMALVWMSLFTKIIAAVLLLPADLWRWAVSLWEGEWPPLGYGYSLGVLLAASLPFLALAYGMRNVYRYRVRRVRILLPDLPTDLEGFRIVQFSDVHSGSLKNLAGIAKGIALINAQQPDLIVFTGDLVNHSAEEMADKTHVFSQLKAKYGVFSILGNHDYGDYRTWPDRESKRANLQHLVAMQGAMGWRLLLNANHLIEVGKAKLALIGVENWSAGGRFQTYGDLRQAHAGSEGADVRMLLSHDPSHWRAQVLKDYPDIALTLSGHTHAAQFGIDLGRIGRWSPSRYVYREWWGLYRNEYQYLYVNPGFGVIGYPGRVGILPELTVLELGRS